MLSYNILYNLNLSNVNNFRKCLNALKYHKFYNNLLNYYYKK